MILVHSYNLYIWGSDKVQRTASLLWTLLATTFIIFFFFFFLISNKEVYSENYLKKTEAGQTKQREKQTEKRTRKQAENNRELNTKERTKEQREGITSGESPSPRPIK